MKKSVGNRKLFSIILISVFISIFVLSVVSVISAQLDRTQEDQQPFGTNGVSAAPSSDNDFFDRFLQRGVDFFKVWEKGEGFNNQALPKYLLWLLLGLIIYSILEESGLMPLGTYGGTNFVTILASAIISFLATAYITPDEVYLLISSYNAMGIAILTILPIIILGLFNLKAIQQFDPKKSWLARLAWTIYGFVLLFRVFYWYSNGDWANKLNETSKFILLLSLGIAALFAIAGGFINGWMRKTYLKEEKGNVNSTLTSAANTAKALKNAGKVLTRDDYDGS